MSGIVGIMKRVAAHEVDRLLTTELGIVTAVFPHAAADDNDNYQCSVQLKNKRLPDGQNLELRQVPIATPYLGMTCIPHVGDLVLVHFIGGDINAPVITGRLYNDADRPPPNKQNEWLIQHTLTAGGSLKLDEQGKIILTAKNTKNIVTLEDEKISLVTEKYSIIIDVSGEKIRIISDKDLELSAKNGKVTIDAQEVEITSSQGTTVRAGADLQLKSSASTTVEASAGMDLQAAAAMTLKGATIDLN